MEGDEVAALLVQLFAQGNANLVHGRVTRHLIAVCLRAEVAAAEEAVAALGGKTHSIEPGDFHLARGKSTGSDLGGGGSGGEGGEECVEGLQGKMGKGGECSHEHGGRASVAIDVSGAYEEMAEVSLVTSPFL